MGKFRAWWLNWRWATVIWGVFWAFQYQGPYHSILWGASVAIALVCAVVWIRQALSFAPFWVRIQPTTSLLIDHGLATREQLDNLDAGAWRKRYVPLRDGIGFTVLKTNDPGSSLVWWNDSRTFSTDVDREVFFRELGRSRPPERRILRNQKDYPGMYVSWGGTEPGLALGTVDTGDSEDDTHDLVRRQAALIPWLQFDPRFWGGGDASAKRRTSLLAKHGWTRGRLHEEIPSAPFELEHKYFRVTYGWI